MDWIPFLYNIFKTIFIVLDLVLLGVLVLSIVKSWEYRPKLLKTKASEDEEIVTAEEARLKGKWDEIMKKISDAPGSLKLAIIEADNLADGILRDMGIEGEHMADRLEQLTKEDFSTIERLWSAHKLRNQLVHEVDFKVSKEEAMEALYDYQAFLKEVKAI